MITTLCAPGEIFIPESGPYRFTDGIDDFTYLAIDADKNGVAGDDPTEVLINDNDWTDTLRVNNGGGGGYGEIEFDVDGEGEWLAIEFNMAEGSGGDGGIIYWDYNPDAPVGDRIGGQEFFPEGVSDPIDAVDAETMFIPDTHLRSFFRELISADLVASTTKTRTIVFDANGDTDMADQLVVENPDPNVYTTILDIDGATFQIAGTGRWWMAIGSPSLMPIRLWARLLSSHSIRRRRGPLIPTQVRSSLVWDCRGITA